MNHEPDPSGAGGFSSGFAGSRPASVGQALCTALRGRMGEFGEDLEGTLQKADEECNLTEDHPSMIFFRAATDQLSTALHAFMTVATSLSMAEEYMFQFKEAVEQESGATSSGFGSGDSEEDPFLRLKALLRQNKDDATQAEVRTIEATFWNTHIARRYRKRAEMLESTLVDNGDEHAVFVLLETDWAEAKKAFTDESNSEDIRLSGASHIHRDAMNRMYKLIKTMRDIPGLEF